MKHSFKTLVAASAIAAMALAAGPASAALTADEAACHAAIGKNITKYQASVAKAMVGCHKNRAKGKVPRTTQCNDVATIDAALGKLAAAATKATLAIQTACDETLAATVRAQYVRCPSPANAADGAGLGAGSGVDNFGELGACLTQLSNSYVEYAADAIVGLPEIENSPIVGALPALSKAQAKCHGSVGKVFAGAVKSFGGAWLKCQTAAVIAGGGPGLLCDFNSANTAGAGKPAASLAAYGALGAAGAACDDETIIPSAELDRLHICGSQPAKITSCGNNDLKNSLTGIMASVFELPGECPTSADVIINAGHGAKGGASRLDSGWKGLAHNVDIIDDSLGAVTLTGCDADCENCTVTHNNRNGNCRCDNDSSIKCNTINGADALCGGNTCHCLFGPPLAISAASTPVCVVNRFASNFTGGTGVVGEYSVDTATLAVVHTGISQTKPCPTCKNDPTPHDNVKGGQCSGGQRNLLACDVDANHPAFGAVSFDCMPSTGANISGSGLRLDLTFSSGVQNLTAAPMSATACTGGSCHCSVCSLNQKVGCSTTADCSAVGAGVCFNAPASANKPEQNNCDGGYANCQDDGNGNGLCQAGPFDNYCDGFLAGSGRGILNCTTDGDCDSNDCTGDGLATVDECGNCTHTDLRQCFLPTITADGTPGVFDSEGVAVFCSGTTGNPGVDNAGGLPGAGRVKLDFNFDLTCDDGVTSFEAPGGSTCP